MTTNHHTVIATGAAANASVFNSPLSQLDTSITTNATNIAATTAEVIAARAAYPNLGARLDDLILAGGNVATKANGVSNAGQKVLTVDSTTGFIVGAYVTYLLNGTTLEGNTIGSIQAGVSLTLGTNIGTGGVLDDSYISMISISEYLAAQAIPHAGTLTLPQTMEYANGGIFNVLAYGAVGDGATDDTAAIQAAITAGAGGVVVFPYTDTGYKCTASIAVSSGTVLKGDNALILHAGYDDTSGTPYQLFEVAEGALNVAFDGLHFKGLHVEGQAFPEVGGVYGKPIDSLDAVGIKITNCIFENISGYAFYVDGGSDALIQGNRFYNSFAYNCNANYTRFIGNHFEKCGAFEGSGDGLLIQGNTFKSPLSDSILSLGGFVSNAHFNPGICVIGNSFQDWAGTGVGVVIGESAENVQIIGNSFHNFTGVGSQAIGNFMGSALNTQRGFVIANNSFANVKTAIYLTTALGLATDVIISGNRIGKVGATHGADLGIYTEIPHTVISGNSIFANTGVELAATATNVYLMGNHWDCTTRTSITAGGTVAGDSITTILTATKTWTPDSTADGATETVTVDVVGCAIGDVALVNLGDTAAPDDIFVTTHSYTDIVRVNIYNKSGSAWEPGAITTQVKVLK